ncbi:hypothetical protein ACROYT_G001180 [Oculina patagonica]
MNQILQSDWFRERAEFSDLDRGQRYAGRRESTERDSVRAKSVCSETNEHMKVLLSKIEIAVYSSLPTVVNLKGLKSSGIKGLKVLQKASIYFFLNKIEL